jgi:hypothetical protein
MVVSCWSLAEVFNHQGTRWQRHKEINDSHRAAVLDFKYFLEIFMESIEFDS